MKFGMFHIIPFYPSKNEKQLVDETLEQIVLAEELGIEEVWLGEHHFSRHGLVSGVFSLMGAVAAQTKRIRLGTAINILPFHNPVQVAEEMATIDVISGGRLNFGIGSGYQRMEFEGMGVDILEGRERFRENLEVIIKAWTEETLTFHGNFTNVDDLWVLPKPIQQPHPPIFQAVSTSPASIEFAAMNNILPMVGGTTDIMGQAPQVVKLWREKMEEFGHPHAHLDPPVSKHIYVAPNMEEAENDRIGREDFNTKILARIGSPAAKDGSLPPGYEAWANRQKDREGGLGVGHAGLPPLRGTPDVVRERLQMVKDQGINRIFSNFGYPGLEQWKVLRSIEMFCKEVMPHFREEPARVG